jgi:hypothetical protein
MKPLRIAGAMKIMEGVTTAEEVLKVTAALSTNSRVASLALAQTAIHRL